MMLIGSTAFGKMVGPAGCGLGNLLFGGKKMQTSASTTNASFNSQWFGITSGTSNCADGSKSAELKNFLDVNQVALANDAAKGNGDSIQGLAEVLGCSSTMALGNTLRHDYTRIFHTPGLSVNELGSGILNAIEADQKLECTKV